MPEELTLEWMNKIRGNYSQGQQLALWGELDQVEPSVLEDWLFSPLKDSTETNLEWCYVRYTAAKIIPWDKFSPKRWMNREGELRKILRLRKSAEIRKKHMPDVSLNMEVKKIEKFIQRVGEWKEFKEKEGIPMG